MGFTVLFSEEIEDMHFVLDIDSHSKVDVGSMHNGNSGSICNKEI